MKVTIQGCNVCPMRRHDMKTDIDFCGHMKVLRDGTIDPSVELYYNETPPFCPLKKEPLEIWAK